VGVTCSSNEVGCSEDEFSRLPTLRRQVLLDHTRQKLSDAGAHAVIETLAEVPALVANLNERLRRGERP
jgi:phosphonoacetaldehyde hydrolase